MKNFRERIMTAFGSQLAVKRGEMCQFEFCIQLLYKHRRVSLSAESQR